MTFTRPWVNWLALAGGLILLALGTAITAFWLWVPNDQQLVRDVEAELASALGVKVSVASVRWQLLPSPAIMLEEVATEQSPAVRLKKLTLYPSLSAMLQRRVAFDLAELDGAVVPQPSLRQLGRGAGGDKMPGQLSLAGIPLVRFVFRDVSWITRLGIPVVYDGSVDFDDSWRPRAAQLRRPDFQPVTAATLTRVEQKDEWRVTIALGGGTVNGDLQLHAPSGGQMRLESKLKPQAVEVASALAAFNRRPVLAGKATGNTTLLAEGANFGDLMQSLQTRTTFVIAPATMLRFDVNKAVRSAGKDHNGQTALDSIAGSMNTQNTPQGMVVKFQGIKAKSGALSASGDATLANRRIQAEFAVDLVDGIVGLPLLVSGPTDNVTVSVPAGAVAGAVVGTAVLPVIGTAIGARVGAAIGKLFGTSPVAPEGAARKTSP